MTSRPPLDPFAVLGGAVPVTPSGGTVVRLLAAAADDAELDLEGRAKAAEDKRRYRESVRARQEGRK